MGCHKYHSWKFIFHVINRPFKCNHYPTTNIHESTYPPSQAQHGACWMGCAVSGCSMCRANHLTSPSPTQTSSPKDARCWNHAPTTVFTYPTWGTGSGCPPSLHTPTSLNNSSKTPYPSVSQLREVRGTRGVGASEILRGFGMHARLRPNDNFLIAPVPLLPKPTPAPNRVIHTPSNFMISSLPVSPPPPPSKDPSFFSHLSFIPTRTCNKSSQTFMG